jgi:hypothetical protein
VRMRDFKLRLRGAIEKATAEVEVSARGGDKWARGLASEGFAGGYAEALRDVEAMILHGHPTDSRRYWRKST